MRKGFTLIEILIAFVVLSIITASVAASYNVAQRNVLVYSAISDIQSIVNAARNDAFTEQEESYTYVIRFDDTAQTALSYLNFDEDLDLGLGDEVIESYSLQPTSKDVIDYHGFSYNDGSGWSGEITNNLFLTFSSPDSVCGISDKIETGELRSHSLVQIPIYRSAGTKPIRYLYFHKVSCNLEVLLEDLTQ